MTEYERTVGVRYQDFDTVGVANNAMFATYAEEGRRGYLTDHLGLDLHETRVVLAHMEFDFERPVTEMTEVSVRVRTTDVGESSYTLAYEIGQDGDRIAVGETVQVTVDDDGRPTPLPDDWRDALTPRVASPQR